MSKNRMTGKDYKKEFLNIKNDLKSLNAHLGERLLDLCKLYPDISKGLYEDLYNDVIETNQIVTNVPIETKIMFITKIEKESAKRQKVIQKELEI